LRGARQVGKPYAVHELGKTFNHFVEINFEQTPEARTIFEKDLSPERINQELFWLTGKQIIPGSTLLFFDEIQSAPKAVTALRYYYEQMPLLHVIAAGSLLDLLSHYLAIGGMPEVVYLWKETQNPFECTVVQETLLTTYRQDFVKYARQNQIKWVELVFNHVPRQLGQKFKYSLIEGDYRKRELAPCLDLLTTAGVVHQIFLAAGQGLPLGAQANLTSYKVMLLDTALSQAALGLDLRDWLLASQQGFINKGSVVEAFIGQEILAYADAYKKEQLYFWQRSEKNSEAEVDFIIQRDGKIIPIEVKSGAGSTLKSMHSFLQTHLDSPYGLRFSTQNYSVYENIYSYPLYAVGNVLIKDKEAIMAVLL